MKGHLLVLLLLHSEGPVAYTELSQADQRRKHYNNQSINQSINYQYPASDRSMHKSLSIYLGGKWLHFSNITKVVESIFCDINLGS